MAHTPIHRRPQTLKQAKRAHQKASGGVYISELELSVIKRRAELQERADRIKARELIRKENLRKRDERREKAREARHRMGVPSPQEGGIHVGPSQLHLGDFMKIGVKRKREDKQPCCKEVIKDHKMPGTEMNLPHTPPENLPPRYPLQATSANIKIDHRDLAYAPKNGGFKAEYSQSKRECSLSVQAPQSRPQPKPTAQQRPILENQAAKTVNKETRDSKQYQSKPMGPPPLRSQLRAKPTISTTLHISPSITPQEKFEDIADETWETFFASNTQITREISPCHSKPTVPCPLTVTSPSKAPDPAPLIPPLKDVTMSVLEQLSTQDLDFSDDLDQLAQSQPQEQQNEEEHKKEEQQQDNFTSLLAEISTQDLDFSDALLTKKTVSSPPPPKSSPSSIVKVESDGEFDGDLTEEDLEDIALQLDQIDTSQNSTAAKYEPWDDETDYEDNGTEYEDDDFEREDPLQDWDEISDKSWYPGRDDGIKYEDDGTEDQDEDDCDEWGIPSRILGYMLDEWYENDYGGI